MRPGPRSSDRIATPRCRRTDLLPSIDPLDLVDPERFAPRRLSARRVDAAAGRGAGRVLRATRATSPSGRSRSTPTSGRSRHNRCAFSNEHGLILGPLGARSPAVGDDRHARPAAPRAPAPGRDAALHAARDPVAPRGDRAHRASRSSTTWRRRTTPREFDFVERIAAPLPIAVISWILGVPRSDWQLLFQWTNEVIGKDDPEFRRPGETAGQTIKRARGEMHAYLGDLIEQRRREPRRRHREPLAERRDRRRAADRAATPPVLRAHRRGGQRDHTQRDQRGVARVLRASRRVGEAPRRSRAPARRGGGDAALGQSRSSTSRAWQPRMPRCTASRSARASTSRCSSRRRTVTRTCSSDPFAFRIDRHPNPHLAFGHRRALLHGRAPRAPRDGDGLPSSARPARVVRGDRARWSASAPLSTAASSTCRSAAASRKPGATERKDRLTMGQELSEKVAIVTLLPVDGRTVAGPPSGSSGTS